jgi:hypothetical protein
MEDSIFVNSLKYSSIRNNQWECDYVSTNGLLDRFYGRILRGVLVGRVSFV